EALDNPVPDPNQAKPISQPTQLENSQVALSTNTADSKSSPKATQTKFQSNQLNNDQAKSQSEMNALKNNTPISIKPTPGSNQARPITQPTKSEKSQINPAFQTCPKTTNVILASSQLNSFPELLNDLKLSKNKKN
ncbi:unnamed protein product, partial [Brachionus calyciflorus]